MADVPVAIGTKGPPADDLTTVIGEGVAGMVQYMMSVLDREDRLESGTGDWLGSFLEDGPAATESMRSSVLRALRLGTDPVNHSILSHVASTGHATPAALEELTGLPRPALAECMTDLTSAGLLSKSPEAGQLRVTGAGAALVEMVTRATTAGVRDLRSGS